MQLLSHQAVPTRPLRVAASRELIRIGEADVNIAIWSREIPLLEERVEAMIQQSDLAASVVTDVRRPETFLEVVSDVPDKLVASAILADLKTLLPIFATALQSSRARVRLETVRNGACRKLHADMVFLRLLCTYGGPATEWVAEQHVVRKNLGRTDVDVEAANASVLRSPKSLNRANPGDVLFLKGERWPGFRGRGAIHRSPPLPSCCSARLVLKADPADDKY
ncbi:MAG: DUF1826 domain-containing protein [Myxococcota bacterium]